MLKVLDLFSGIGGFSLGLERTGGFETVAFCEIEPFPRRVLAKHWPDVPCFDDVRKLTGADIGPVDVICGGYPCQPFSSAGKRQGAADDRHLWPEFIRLVAELRPAWVIGENVAGHISMGLDDVLADLEAEGYACRTFVIPACAVGASHRRDRVWTVAHRDSERGTPVRGQCEAVEGEGFGGRHERGRSSCDAERQVANGGTGEDPGDVAHAAHMQRNGGEHHAGTGDGQIPELGARSGANALADPAIPRLSDGQRARQPENAAQDGTGLVAQPQRCGAHVADTIGGRRPGPGQPIHAGDQAARGKRQADEFVYGGQRGKRSLEPRVGGMADGFSCWLHEPGERVKAGVKDRAPRLKALGNAVHPDIPMMIGRAILESEMFA